MSLCTAEEAVMARPIWTGAITVGLVSTKKSAPTSGGDKSPAVTAMTKNDLFPSTRDLDIPGRSPMTRPEVEKAVKKARKPARRAS
jgi:hypothetical protein